MKKIKKKDLYKILLIISMILISIFIRFYFLSIKSDDYNFFLEGWFNTLKENGGIYALKLDLGDYNLPYVQILALLTYLPIEPLYSIKMISIIFDYIGAISIGLLIYHFTRNKDISFLGFFITTMLPTVVLNSSAWAQCDFIYVTFIILSILFLIKNKYLGSFVFLGIAFAFKLQTIFVLPIFILYYISERKFPIYYFFIIPIIDIILCLPSIIVGKPIIEILNVYVNQTGEYSNYISMNFPGIYNIFFEPIENTNLIEMPSKMYEFLGIGITGIIYFLFAIFVFVKKIKFSEKNIIKFIVWSVMICTYFLPKIHDRYMFAADVISIVCIFIDNRKKYLPIFINGASLYTYIYYLFNGNYRSLSVISIILGLVLIYYTLSIFKELLQDNKLLLEKEK